jgi:hypothetical protein
MRNRFGAILAVALTLTLGCNEKTPSDGGPAKQASSQAASVASPASGAASTATNAKAELGKGLGEATKTTTELVEAAKEVKALAENKTPGVTVEAYEALLLKLSDCAVTGSGIDRKCDAYKALRQARKNRGTLVKDWGGAMAGLGRKHISHANPAVRIQAASLMGSIFGTSADSQTLLIKAATGEKHPEVLKQILRTLASSIGKNPAIKDLLLSQADHANDKVRMEVVSGLTSTWAKGTTGTLEKAMEMVEKDTSNDVRNYACRRLGERADERVLPLLKKLTKAPGDNPKLYSACFRGLIAMWSSPVAHAKPSKKAYQLTLKLLAKKPRSSAHPPWTAIPAMEWAKQKRFSDNAPWFKRADLVAVLGKIVADKKANWLARSSGVDAMRKLGASQADFAKLEAIYAGAKDTPGTDKRIYEKIKKAGSQAK